MSHAAGSDGRIPVLDLAPFLADEPGALQELARHVARTCEDTGFLVVANHRIPQELIAGCFAEAARFFDLEMERKLALKVGELNIGYLPRGAQTVRTSTVHANSKPNLNESFYIVRDRAPDNPDILARKPFVSLNRWPDSQPDFRAVTTAYFQAMQELAHRMLAVFATALDLPPAYFDPDFRDPACTLRLIRYEPQPMQAEDQFGFAPHIDTNFTTYLAQSKLPGLEVRTRDGTWIRPPAIPDTFVVNTGEMLGRYSNDRFAPTPHRVVNANDQARYAIPFFYGPDDDAVIRVVPSCTGPGNPPRYEPLLYSNHRRRLNRTNFEHRQGGKPEAG
ncbi:isopenicillin N synthase family dioxygenase [Falsiroseomonas sp. E2-1-a4]|uniref:isopenicillin N synthase family dioxygenase n=1 Tax=Falsiroseomonas sp. E2-1-a4 TaxID=3239299 RepID=UPI003F3E005B